MIDIISILTSLIIISFCIYWFCRITINKSRAERVRLMHICRVGWDYNYRESHNLTKYVANEVNASLKTNREIKRDKKNDGY